MRKLELFEKKYGPEAGRVLYHTLQSQAAHASVSARLRRKITALSHPPAQEQDLTTIMPLFGKDSAENGAQPAPVANSAYQND